MKITNWPKHRCKISKTNYNYIFNIQNSITKPSVFIKPFLAKINNDTAEILIGHFREFQDSELPIYPLSDNINSFELLKIITDYYLSDQELNFQIISNILNYMDGIETKIEDKKRYISEKLHLSPKPKTIETFKKFSLILPQISDYLVEKKAPLKVWEYLTILNENDQKIFLKLIKTFKPSMSNFLEIVENIAELIQLQKEGDIIHQIDKIINSNSPQPLMQIKETIVQLRYPVLSAHRKDILEIFANLQIPNNLTIHFDTNFEKKEIHGSFTICNNDDILKLQHFCREINIDNLKNILKKL